MAAEARYLHRRRRAPPTEHRGRVGLTGHDHARPWWPYGFAAFGVLSDGTTVAVGVNWRATGGSVDAGGAYTAGTDAGFYR